MTAPTFTVALVEGLAQLLADAGIGLAWRPSGVYGPGDGVPIFVLGVPQQPDELVTISPYPVSADGTLADSEIGVQVRTRCGPDPRRALTIDDRVQDVLLGNYPLTLPSSGVVVSTLIYANGGSLGQDDVQRWEWQSSFMLRVHRPGPHRI